MHWVKLCLLKTTVFYSFAFLLLFHFTFDFVWYPRAYHVYRLLRLTSRSCFFYLSPLFSICKLTQSSPLGKLIKFLFCVVLKPRVIVTSHLTIALDMQHVQKSKLDLKLVQSIVKSTWRQRGRVVRAPDLKSGGHGFKSRSDHLAGVVSWWTLVQLLGHACI